MPILPIDLQTMFSHINQVGKEQAIQNEKMPQNQALQGQALVEKIKDKDSTVNETEDVGQGVDKLKNQAKGKQQKRGKQHKDEDEKEKDTIVVYKDPNLGQHIDISG